MRSARHLCLALGFALLCGCAQKTNESSVSSSDTTRTALRAQSESEITLHLAQTRAHIDSLREEASRVGAKMDAALAAKLAQVETERDSAQQQLDRLRSATETEWNDLQYGLTTALDSLDAKIDRLRAGMPRRKP
jgi:hypothetical protein